MDGVYNSEHLCFVLSQFDREFGLRHHLDTNKEVRKAAEPIFVRGREVQQKLTERETRLQQVRESRERHCSLIEELESRIRELQAETHGKKRKRIDEPTLMDLMLLEDRLNDLKITTGAEAEEEIKLVRGVKHLEIAHHFNISELRLACNNDRKQKSIARVRQDFEQTQQQMGLVSTTPLQVFCTSAETFLKYENPNLKIRKQGFPSRQDTEIPQLRDCFNKFTFAGRDQRAQEILERFEQLVSSMKPWIGDQRGDLKISAGQRERWEPLFEVEIEQLSQVCP